MKATMTIHLRRFPVQILDERTGIVSTDTIVFDKRSLQAAELIHCSSRELIFSEYNRRGFKVLQIGKAEKQTVELDLEALFSEQAALCKECGVC